MRKTKIVCTIGPATKSEEKLEQLMKAGMDVARLNFSHGTYEEHEKVLKNIRRIAEKLNKPVAILQDLQGPKLRIGKFENGSIALTKNSDFIITTQKITGNDKIVSTSYASLIKDVEIGDAILLDDGLIQLKVKSISETNVTCVVVEGGQLSDHKGINLPYVKISQPSFTEKDQQDLLFGIEQEVDFVAVSFVRGPADILQVQQIIKENKKDILVIAKLEKPEAIEQLDEIITVADGIMVARGDLGVELPLEKVPPLQKRIISCTREKGKPVITATQMLESMRFHARPTRAEVSDVANAIFDGTDAVMLSAETAVGNFPIESVKTMSKVIEEAELTANHFNCNKKNQYRTKLSIPDSISCAACETAELLNVKAIVAFTLSGFTARMVSKYRPRTNIIAFTTTSVIQRQLNLSWGVTPHKMKIKHSSEEIIHDTEQVLLAEKWIKLGDKIVILLGSPINKKGITNLMKLHIVGDSIE